MSESPKKTRPRPRPRPRSVTSSTQVNEPGSSNSPPILEDETATFFRNRNRKTSNWRELNKVIEKREADRAQTQDLSSSDYDSDSPRTKKARRRPFVPKPKELPAWTKPDGLILIKDSDEEKSSSDGEASDSAEKAINGTASPERITKAKKKRRATSRSSSASSNPEVYIAEQEGRARARELLGSQTTRREKSPTYISDNDEGPDAGGDLPAEFAAIRAEMKRSSTRGASVDDTTLTSVDLQIILRPHPENETGRSHVYSHRLRRNEKFEQLFNEIADEAGIPTERLFVFFNNHRVYPWSTPQTLSIWSEAELIAYEEHVYKYIKAHDQRALTSADIEGAAGPSAPTLEHADYEEGYASPPEPSQDKSDSYRLHVRMDENTITIGVRNATKCGRIVEKVLEKVRKSISAAKKARIVVDGEKLDPESEIGDAELEDGDLIDIVDA